MSDTTSTSVPAMDQTPAHRTFLDYIVLFIKGLAVGAANVIPGVSGGTIAFLTGIYQELIDSLKSIDGEAMKYLFTFKWKSFGKKINFWFLLAVCGGLVVSIFSLARLMTYLMKYQPIAIWSFFFGLVIASSIYVLKEIKHWSWREILALLVGGAIGAAICLLTPGKTPDGLWFVFIAGAIAVTAMILPGISGSFIMLLMGKYDTIMTALGNISIGQASGYQVWFVVIFFLGCIVGLLSFSHLLSWLLKKFYDATICLLSGFMLGSLLKVWPWNITLPSGISRVLTPGSYAVQVGNPQVWTAVLWCLVGVVIVVGSELLSAKRSAKSVKE
jgi:putative membrane protein